MKPLTSPFAGMDPFMEDPSLWRGIHTRLIVAISDLLQEVVPLQFFVNIKGSVVVSMDDVTKRVVPDTYIVRDSVTREEQSSLTQITPSLTLGRMPIELHEERWIEIVDKDSEEVITIVEILSPANKVEPGFSDFASKCQATFQSATNRLEIDLLRAGKRLLSIFGNKSADYYALSARATHSNLELWPIFVRDQLPTVAVPMADGDADVPLDLQAALSQVDKAGQYGRKLRYDRPMPAPRFSAENDTWLRQKITQWRQQSTK